MFKIRINAKKRSSVFMDDRGVSQCSKASSRGSQSYIYENSKKSRAFHFKSRVLLFNGRKLIL